MVNSAGEKHRAYPQFLHNRAHRPRQEHARRQAAGHHRGCPREGADGPDPGHHGTGARAWHNHQGPGRPPAPQAPRRRLDAQPHRHPRPRGLHLRGLQGHSRLRRRPARRGRGAGRPGPHADAPRPTPTAPPGHVDFPYEVSRAIAACEGALLVVDASQGIQAQTLANLYLAMEQDLEIIPVLNKIDLPVADVPAATQELVELLGVDEDEILKISAKTGEGVIDVLNTVVDRVPPPTTRGEQARALIFDSYYDPYRGVVSLARLFDGELSKGDIVQAMGTEEMFELLEVGCYSPKPTALPTLRPGEVGYVIAGLKDIEALRVGDTVTRTKDPASEPLPGYAEVLPTVFCGLYPTEGDEFERLRDALSKLQLNDASLFYEPENSRMGFGFRCGFLGLLHMEIVQERLEREFDLDLIASSPSVKYEVETNGETVELTNPTGPPEDFDEIREPMVRATIICPKEYVGPVMGLRPQKTGTSVGMEHVSPKRVQPTYDRQ